LLAEIDNRETVAKQLIGQGELDAARAQALSDAELIVAQKAVEVAKAELESQKEIRKVNPGAVSLTELRKYDFQVQRAEAQVKLAETDRNIASLTAKTKEAQLQAIDIEFDRRTVKSPFPGEVIEIFRKRGEWVQAGEPVMHIARLDKCRVKGFVYAIAEVSPHELEGKPVEIIVQSTNGKELHVKGTVGYASEIIEGVGSSRQFRIWADVENQRLTDEVSKQQYWAIQPGSMAKMVIDLSPPPAPKTTPVRPKLTPVRNEARKPVIDDNTGSQGPGSRER
jgi:multidrug resistance efflux pump